MDEEAAPENAWEVVLLDVAVGDERDDVLLRGVGGEHGGAECEFESGECDACDEHDGDQLR